MHWLLLVACGGVNTAIDQPDIAVWSHMTAISGLVMVLQAPGTAFLLRGSGVPCWRRRVVLVPATLGLLAIGFVVGLVNLPGATPADYVWLLSFGAICAVLAALVMLLWGVLCVLEDVPRRRAIRHSARDLGLL
ncbi:MAG TPA: hypothetical protein VFU88_11415 [Ktedonobacterales bacterium]|nr:hypothetical protein [Ktedonobacterales bacterium]